jgi:hypothetical protein
VTITITQGNQETDVYVPCDTIGIASKDSFKYILLSVHQTEDKDVIAHFRRAGYTVAPHSQEKRAEFKTKYRKPSVIRVQDALIPVN